MDMMPSTHGTTAHTTFLSSFLTYLTPWDPRESLWESCYRVHMRRRSQVENDPPEGSPKVDFRMVLILWSEELGRTAYMGMQPTHGTVQVSHGSRSW